MPSGATDSNWVWLETQFVVQNELDPSWCPHGPGLSPEPPQRGASSVAHHRLHQAGVSPHQKLGREEIECIILKHIPNGLDNVSSWGAGRSLIPQ